MRAEEWSPVIEEILSTIATTPKSLETICKEIESAPHARTFWKWLEQDPELGQRYARAREAQIQILADQLVDLADTDRICEKVVIKGDGSREVTIGDQVERTRLQIDTRKWLLAKLKPKVYGEKLQVDGELGIKTVILRAEAQTKLPDDPQPEF